MSDDTVTMRFDEPEASGEITLVRCGWGAVLLVDGREVALVDLFPRTQREVPQLIIYGGAQPRCDEPLAKVLIYAARNLVVVNRDAKEVPTKRGIHDGERAHTL